MCENALLNLKVFSGDSFLTSFEIFDNTFLLFFTERVFFDNTLNFSTILKNARPS